MAQVAQAYQNWRSSSNVREGFEIVVIITNNALAVETNTLVTNLNLIPFLNSSLCATFQIGCTVLFGKSSLMTPHRCASAKRAQMTFTPDATTLGEALGEGEGVASQKGCLLWFLSWD